MKSETRRPINIPKTQKDHSLSRSGETAALHSSSSSGSFVLVHFVSLRCLFSFHQDEELCSSAAVDDGDDYKYNDDDCSRHADADEHHLHLIVLPSLLLLHLVGRFFK